jgi:hypothetical protein
MAAATFSSLDALLACMTGLGAVRVVAKALSENDNLKQQIYLGGNFESLSVIPYQTVVEDARPATPNLKAAVSLRWITDGGLSEPAPHTKLILYPNYPEVRLSGFIRGCSSAPSHLLQPIPRSQRRSDNAPDGRVLLFGISGDGTMYGYVAAANTPLAREFKRRAEDGDFTKSGVFWQRRLDARSGADSRSELLRRLTRIKEEGWHWSRRLRDGAPVPYRAPNGGGYTLEALFGIKPNGVAEPDFLGWELKACGSDRVTLMTPEPNGGYYGENGAEAFLRRYGRYLPHDLIYFTGTHRVGEVCEKSGQELTLVGYVPGGKGFDALGHVQLIDARGAVSASWSFAKLLEDWGRKHAFAAYVPCESRPGPPREYAYGSPVHLGEATSFLKLLTALSSKFVYYDPGPKLEHASTPKKKVHARSQFRIRVTQLSHLYETFTSVAV